MKIANKTWHPRCLLDIWRAIKIGNKMARSPFSIQAYRQATQPIRSMLLARYRSQKQVPISVLYYHRVADWQPTPWTITRDMFKKHMDWLQENQELISLDEAIRRIKEGENQSPAAVVTFDDGYADNMDFAMPLLVERKIPCTYYVSTYQVINQQPFQHDRPYPSRLYPNSVGDIKQLVKWGIDIGAHTCHHVDLAKIEDENELRTELKGCRRQLMNLFGCPVNHFAFPFGQRTNITAQAIALSREAGFASVSSAYGGYNTMGQDPFFIQRFHGDPMLERVQNWLTIDPRFLNVRPDAQWLPCEPVEVNSPVGAADCGTVPFHSSFPQHTS